MFKKITTKSSPNSKKSTPSKPSINNGALSDMLNKYPEFEKKIKYG